jgi:hypothetical protein
MMTQPFRCNPRAAFVTAALVSVGVMLATPAAMAAEPAKGGPAKVEVVEGLKVKRVTLTEKAAHRLDIHMGEIREDPSGSRVAPFTSVFYDLAGNAWVFTSPAPLKFMRQKVVPERVTGHDVYLKEGPPAGTQVVIVGVAELYGAEVGVGK